MHWRLPPISSTVRRLVFGIGIKFCDVDLPAARHRGRLSVLGGRRRVGARIASGWPPRFSRHRRAAGETSHCATGHYELLKPCNGP